jgi:hypothetical protein
MEKVIERKVTIRQTQGRYTPIPHELRNEFVKRIGSKFDKDTKDVLIGLTEQEREIILPKVIVNDRTNKGLDWNIKVRDYYSNLTIDVPYGEEGRELNISTKKQKVTNLEGEVVEFDYPIAPADYIIWKQCLADSTVATTKHELRNKENFTFYLVDTNEDKRLKLQLRDDEDTLDTMYLKLVSKDENGEFKKKAEVDACLRLLGSNPSMYEDLEKKDELSTYKNSSKDSLKEGVKLKDTLFYRVLNDEDLSIKSIIMVYVEAGILEQEGTYYREPQSDTIIGSDLNQAVNFMKDSNNSELVTKMKFKLKGEVKT